MTWLSIALIAIGLADLVRARATRQPARSTHLLPAIATGVTAPVALALATGLTALPDVVAVVISAAGVVGWVVSSERTQTTGRGAGVPLAIFAAVLIGLVLFSGYASEPAGVVRDWLSWADLPGRSPMSPDRALLVLALVLLNIATANIIVRLVLLAVGALRSDQVVAASTASTDPEPADRLKGGRLLGPMERLLIFGVGLAGEFAAAGLVIAAKGLLRFPEIQAASRSLPATPATGAAPPHAPGTSARHFGSVGIDDVTEYFLIGSFVSWLVALSSLALALLG